VTLQLLYRYRPALQQYLLRSLQVQVRPIQIMSSQPQILSIEDLNTADAKYVFLFGRNFPPHRKARLWTDSHLSSLLDISEKVGQPEED
jgi:hypothetical protein